LIKNRGMRHLALKVSDLERTKDFYVRVFGMKLVWQPDADNAYLSTGSDNLALHRGPAIANEAANAQRLDHLGFIVATIADLEASYAWAQSADLEIVHELKHHRDGSVSFYIRDPDGNLIQALYEPTISPQTFIR
jgi:catechol 2,3-dioxygenase-like lactoylglutathione lyase family enzyme